MVRLQQQISIFTAQLDRKDKVINKLPKKQEKREHIEPRSHCCSNKVSHLEEEQNTTQQHEPSKSSMTPSTQNKELTNIISQVKSTFLTPKDADASSSLHIRKCWGCAKNCKWQCNEPAQDT